MLILVILLIVKSPSEIFGKTQHLRLSSEPVRQVGVSEHVGLIFYDLLRSHLLELLGCGPRVDLGVKLCLARELVIALHEEAAGFLVERALGERHDEEALDNAENVSKTPLLRIPIPFESIDANVAGGSGHIRVEDLRQEVALWGSLGEVGANHKLTTENASVERGVH